MDRGTFVQRFPEFDSADPDAVTAALAQADRQVSDTWVERREDFVGYVAADLLARSPFGRDARLVKQGGDTVYSATIERLKAAHGVGRFRLA